MPDDIFYPKGATVTCVMVWKPTVHMIPIKKHFWVLQG